MQKIHLDAAGDGAEAVAERIQEGTENLVNQVTNRQNNEADDHRKTRR